MELSYILRWRMLEPAAAIGFGGTTNFIQCRASSVSTSSSADIENQGHTRLPVYGRATTRVATWITNLNITADTERMRVGRLRWQIENQVINRLNNHGNQCEHNQQFSI